MWKNENKMQGKVAMELLVSIGGIVERIRSAVAFLERGRRDEGMAQLQAAIDGVRGEITSWQNSGDEAPLPREQVVGELEAVLDELLAARQALETAASRG
ncbi:hypothetical protein H5T52_00870 [Candidatus Bipolaricaulota bacterium]|nr:hypothetical protein [Candidatus Bipolaricaulota bacterium]